MSKRLLIFICIALLLTACGEQDFTDTSVIYTSEGGSVSLPYQPQNVAVLFSSFADIWLAAGGEIAITVGESVERGFADENVVLVDGGAGKSIDIERLIASSPDLVICSADIEAQADAARVCRAADIPVLMLSVESFGDYLEALEVMCAITGNKENYKLYGEDLQSQVASIIKENSFDGTEILFIRASSSARATKAKTADDHFAAAMLKELGTYNIAESAQVLLDGLSFEEILMHDPEHIFISAMGDEDAVKEYMNSLLSEAPWQSLTAVKENNVHYLPKELFQYKPNSKWDEAYEYLASLLAEAEQ